MIPSSSISSLLVSGLSTCVISIVSTRLRFAEEIWLQSHFVGVETICASRTWRLNFLQDLDCEYDHSFGMFTNLEVLCRFIPISNSGSGGPGTWILSPAFGCR